MKTSFLSIRKNIFKHLIPVVFILLATVPASAQGEWKWAHYWTGGDGTLGSYYNEITNTAFDEEGNIYVYGSMGGSPQFDGLTFLFVNNGTVLDRNDHSIATISNKHNRHLFFC